jgi:hypothetical protein
MDWSIDSYWMWILGGAIGVAIATPWMRWKLKRGKDIVWPSFPDNLTWTDAATAETSIGEIYKYAVGFSKGSIEWYQDRRRPKRVAGFLLRVAALVATFAAGFVPLSKQLGGPDIPPEVSTVLLALAGLFVSIDRLGGFTSGWVRYMLAQQRIERAKDTFHMEWNSLKLAGGERHALLDRATAFLAVIGKIVDDETKEWATEFQNALNELERVRKEEADTPRSGALEITVRNPQAVTAWTLEVDGNQRGSTTGKSLAVTDVPIGQRKIRISGRDGQGSKTLSDEKIVRIEGGMTVSRELELN